MNSPAASFEQQPKDELPRGVETCGVGDYAEFGGEWIWLRKRYTYRPNPGFLIIGKGAGVWGRCRIVPQRAKKRSFPEAEDFFLDPL